MVCEDSIAHTKGDVVKKGYYMDGYLETNLIAAKDLVSKDWDMIVLVDGYEGSGKSVLAMQAAYFCDPTLNLDRLCFNPDTFRKAIIEAKKFTAVIYDEAYTGLSSRAAMGRINRALVTMLAEIRQKNLFVFVVMPTFFDLDKYVALWRSRALLHVYVSKSMARGYFMFYSMDRKKSLFVEGKKFYSYYKPDPNFRGRFTNFYPVDEAEYRKKKAKALSKRETLRAEIELKKELEAELFNRLAENKNFTDKQKYELLGMPRATFYYKLKAYKEEKAEFKT